MDDRFNRESDLPALSLHGIAKRFGGLRILDEVTLIVCRGERRALIGPNGAGKTTLLNIIAGNMKPSRGEIFLFGEPITRLPAHQRVRKGLVRTFQKNNLFGELTVLDHLLLALQSKHDVGHVFYRSLSRRRFSDLYAEAERLLSRWGLLEQKNEVVKHLSYGEQRQLEILIGVAFEAKVLLLDEPTAGMSSAETRAILHLLKQMPREMTIVFVEHDMDVVFGLADVVSVLHNGRVIAEGPPEAVRRDRRVQEIYFGSLAEVSSC